MTDFSSGVVSDMSVDCTNCGMPPISFIFVFSRLKLAFSLANCSWRERPPTRLLPGLKVPCQPVSFSSEAIMLLSLANGTSRVVFCLI